MWRTIGVVDQHLIIGGSVTVAQTVVLNEERTEHEVVVDHHSGNEQQKPGEL